MPKPVYILCAENVSIDQQTNLVSVFNIIEKIDMSLFRDDMIPPPQPRLSVTGAKVVAVWAKVKGDEGKQFESQIQGNTTDGSSFHSDIIPVEFKDDKVLSRIVVTIPRIPPMHESGMLTITCKIRKKNAKSWQFQTCEIPVTVTIHSPPATGKAKK